MVLRNLVVSVYFKLKIIDYAQENKKMDLININIYTGQTRGEEGRLPAARDFSEGSDF